MQAPSRDDLVLALHAVGERDGDRVGTKAARLGLLARVGLAVPEGLVLTAATADAVREHAGLGPDATADQVLAAALPAAVEAALATVAAHFADATVAVRSSAADEDTPGASYAGQYESVLHVRGPDALRDAVRRCWASAHSERVRSYRRRAGGSGVSIAVLVQRQVEADVAGVAFTADPVTGAQTGVLVSAVPGLGDGLVSGAVRPDEWLVRGGSATPIRVSHQALAEAQAQAVATLALRVQDILGGPQDVEWAMAGGRLVVLQARPITALPRAPEVRLPEGTWVKETERHPEPVSELGASIITRLVPRGLTAMAHESGGLIDRFDMQVVGGEPYLRVTPLGGRGGPPPPWWVLAIISRLAPPLRRQMRRAKALLRPGVLDGMQQQWEQQWRPELQQQIAQLQAVELSTLDDRRLVAQLDAVTAAIDHGLDVHFRLTVPYLIPIHTLLVECHRLGWTDERAIELVAGTSGATSAPSRALAELAESVRADPRAAAVLERAGTDVAEQLRQVAPALGDAFEDWCVRFGLCCANDDPGSPTLAELPGTLVGLLNDAVRETGEDAQRRTAATRATRAAEARAVLAGRPAGDRDRFERVLAAALRAYPLREDSAFWTASMPCGLVRLCALEFGRRLVERGALDRAGDVVDLGLDALRSSLADPPDNSDGLRTAVARARAERAYVRAHPGPAHYGPPPQPLPDLRGLPAAGREINEAMLYMRRSTVAAPPTAGALLHGTPASAGRHTGPVRVIAGPADFGRLRAGDVLVCPTTDPAWSVLFGVAGALVTDGGNVLSHAAIVAREHAIPAVVGAGNATRTLHDGQLVAVDGSTGVVLAGR